MKEIRLYSSPSPRGRINTENCHKQASERKNKGARRYIPFQNLRSLIDHKKKFLLISFIAVGERKRCERERGWFFTPFVRKKKRVRLWKKRRKILLHYCVTVLRVITPIPQTGKREPRISYESEISLNFRVLNIF